MTALSGEARERLRDRVYHTDNDAGVVVPAIIGSDLRALLDALDAAERDNADLLRANHGLAQESHERGERVAKLQEALECAQYELRLWVQTYGERGPTRFVLNSIDSALRDTAPPDASTP